MTAVIKASGLSKWYAPQQRGLRGFIRAVREGPNRSSKLEEVPEHAYVALHPISFELERGQVLGVVGRNGAGKSTLLQLLSGTLAASSGSIEIGGRVAALLELGAGFNPEFTGLDNVFLNAALLGLSQDEVRERLDSILRFAEIGAFIHQPVKTYSSGMFVRLAFSVAVCVDPDILIIDEALAVGDGPFARKSFQKIMEFRDDGRTILFCSHSLYQVEALCSQVIWLDQGRVKGYGSCADVLAAYSQFIDRAANPSTSVESLTTSQDVVPGSPIENEPQSPDAMKQDDALVAPANPRLTGVKLWHNGTLLRLDDEAERRLVVQLGSPCELALEINWQMTPQERGHGDQSNFELPTVAVSLITAAGQCLAAVSTFGKVEAIAQDAFGRGCARLKLSSLPLCKGQFRLDVLLGCSRGLQLYDQGVGVLHIDARSPAHEQGMIQLAHGWETMTKAPADDVAAFYESMRSYCQDLSAYGASGPTGMLNFGYWPEGTAHLHAAQQAFLGLLIQALETFAPQTANWQHGCGLEFGCGLGGISFGVLTRLQSVKLTGLDVSASQLKQACDHAQALGLASRFTPLQSNAMDVDLPDACMDFTLCIESSFHYPDKAAFFSENFRVLKPGGSALVADITCANPALVRFRKGNHFASGQAYAHWAQEAGFEVAKLTDLGPQVFGPLLKHVVAFNAAQVSRDRRGRYWEMVLANYLKVHTQGSMGYELLVLQKPLPQQIPGAQA